MSWFLNVCDVDLLVVRKHFKQTLTLTKPIIERRTKLLLTLLILTQRFNTKKYIPSGWTQANVFLQTVVNSLPMELQNAYRITPNSPMCLLSIFVLDFSNFDISAIREYFYSYSRYSYKSNTIADYRLETIEDTGARQWNV